MTPTGETVPERFVPELRTRELQILNLLSHGLTYDQIGDTLGIARGTVRTYINMLYRALGVKTQAEAVRVGFELELLKPR